MALNTDVQFHIQRVNDLSDRNKPLRDRQEADHGQFRGDRFHMPKDEGKWDEVTTNRPTSEGNKIIDYLSYARRKLWIPISDEKEKNRKDLSATERLAIGVLRLADDISQNDPYGISLQNLAAFYSVVRGWRAWCVYLGEEEDNLTPYIKSWDPFNTYFVSGSKGMLWVSNVRYAYVEEIQDEYEGWNGAVDENKRAAIYSIWDKEELGTIAGTDWVREPKKHGLDHIPVRIRAGRSTPYIQSERYPDTIANVGESYLVNNRHIYRAESRLLTYNMTRAGRLAKTPVFVSYNSNNGGQPPEFEVDPNAKGAVLYLDKAKGQEIIPQNTLAPGNHIDNMLSMINGLGGIGGLSPVAYGSINQALPAQGIDILAHQTMDVIKPFKQGIEEDFVWIAEEIVRQYKGGSYGATQFEGYDNANNRFRAKISPKDIDINWRFECELVPDLLRDEQMNMNMATQAVKSELLSPETARDRYHLVDDTDLENNKIERHKAEQLAQVSMWEMISELAKDKGMNYPPVQFLLRQMMQSISAPGQPGGASPAGAGPMGGSNIVVPGMTPESTTPSVPQEIQQKARLARMGMVKG